MVRELGDMAKALDRADAGDMAALYEALGLMMPYNHNSRSAEVADAALPAMSPTERDLLYGGNAQRVCRLVRSSASG
jgi:hypothetical protein